MRVLELRAWLRREGGGPAGAGALASGLAELKLTPQDAALVVPKAFVANRAAEMGDRASRLTQLAAAYTPAAPVLERGPHLWTSGSAGLVARCTLLRPALWRKPPRRNDNGSLVRSRCSACAKRAAATARCCTRRRRLLPLPPVRPKAAPTPRPAPLPPLSPSPPLLLPS